MTRLQKGKKTITRVEGGLRELPARVDERLDAARFAKVAVHELLDADEQRVDVAHRGRVGAQLPEELLDHDLVGQLRRRHRARHAPFEKARGDHLFRIGAHLAFRRHRRAPRLDRRAPRLQARLPRIADHRHLQIATVNVANS